MDTRAQFAAWLDKEHPDIFEVMYAHHIQRRFSGLGDDLPEVDVTATTDNSTTPLTTVDESTLTDTAVDIPVDNVNIATDSAADTTSGWGSGVLSALSSVGNYLVSPQGLTTLAQVGTAVLKTQQAQATANMQMAIINANAQRAATGQSPIPITYAQNAQGATVPVYDTSTMQQMPVQLEQAIAEGRAHPVTLPDGSTGYAMDNPTLSTLLGNQLPWYVWAGIAAVVLLAVA